MKSKFLLGLLVVFTSLNVLADKEGADKWVSAAPPMSLEDKICLQPELYFGQNGEHKSLESDEALISSYTKEILAREVIGNISELKKLKEIDRKSLDQLKTITSLSALLDPPGRTTQLLELVKNFCSKIATNSSGLIDRKANEDCKLYEEALLSPSKFRTAVREKSRNLTGIKYKESLLMGAECDKVRAGKPSDISANIAIGICAQRMSENSIRDMCITNDYVSLKQEGAPRDYRNPDNRGTK